MGSPRSVRPLTILATATALATVAGALPAFAQEQEEGEEAEDVIVVQATRSGQRVQDEPIRVEVIVREEIEEKLLMTPGNISMLVAETGGVRVQTTAPALGAANIRMQGMSGRYTQLLADGLPLYGGQASSIGLMQIPPTDLGQVEIIKGSASALYGPSALGGVINLVSRRPEDEAVNELLLNATTREGQDVTAYHAAPVSDEWSYSVVGGLHHQTEQDRDEDGWIDMPGYDRWTVRPRLFWESAEGASALITLGAMQEDRVGGTLPGRIVPDGSAFANTQDSRRINAGLVSEFPVTANGTLHLRASGMALDNTHVFGSVREDDTHETAFGEVSYAMDLDATLVLFGAAYQADSFATEAFPVFDYNYETPGVFAQVEQEIGDEVTLAASARWDDHNVFGDHFSPRLSALWRPGPWRVRASLGEGFYAPTPFVDEIEAAGLSRLESISGLRAETARTGSVDVGYAEGPVEASVTLFGSDIDDAVQLFEVDADTVRLVNADGVTRTRGAELLLRYRWDSFTVTGSYVHVDADEPDPQTGVRRTLPLTPQQTAGMVAMWEEEGVGRVGFEMYYTGEQDLDDNPFRTVSEPYVEMGLLGEVVLGDFRVFVNLENLLGVRQTRHDPLVRPTRAPDGGWTVDAWQPLDGFTVNAGVRVSG